MKVAVSAYGKTLGAKTCERFGRCKYFVIVETDTDKQTVLRNTAAHALNCAGTTCAQKLFGAEVKAVVTGKVGPNAYEVLEGRGVAVYLTQPGLSVREAFEKFKTGSLPQAQAPIEKGMQYENCYFSMR